MIATLVLTALLASPGLAPQQDEPDVVVLNDGTEIFCRVLYEDDETVVYREHRKKEKEVSRSEVQSLQTIEMSLHEFFEQFDRIDKQNPTQIAELAKWCESRELLGEARGLWIRILTLDPDNEEAWTKLGGVHSKSRGWRLKVRGRYKTLEDLRERVGEWKHAMELPTAHFLVKTNVAPERALDIAVNLERAYITYYDLIGPHLRLYPFDEVPQINLYANAKDYPVPPTPRDAWFAYAGNELHVKAVEGVNPNEVMSNLTFCLLYNSFRRTLGKTGSIAAWARRGLSEAFGAALRIQGGVAVWDFESPYMPHFVSQVNDDEPLSMEDVIKAGLTSFDSGKNAHRYLAQSYTLAHFLARAHDRKYRPRFAEYLRSSFVGKGSVTHFEKIMDVDLEELEVEWNAYVREIAGA